MVDMSVSGLGAPRRREWCANGPFHTNGKQKEPRTPVLCPCGCGNIIWKTAYQIQTGGGPKLHSKACHRRVMLAKIQHTHCISCGAKLDHTAKRKDTHGRVYETINWKKSTCGHVCAARRDPTPASRDSKSAKLKAHVQKRKATAKEQGTDFNAPATEYVVAIPPTLKEMARKEQEELFSDFVL